MAGSFAELLYELASRSLHQQEQQIVELRGRTQTLLAAATLIASFFGATELERSGLTAPSSAAMVAPALSIIAGIYVLVPHSSRFVLDAREVHRRLYDADREDLDEIHTRVAFTLRELREHNAAMVDRMFRAFEVGAVALAAQIALWGWALGVD